MAQAIDALKRAVSRHGLEGVQLYPTTLSDAGTVTVTTTNFLGTLLAEARDVAQETPAPLAAVDGSPEAEACRALFAALIPLAAAVGAKSGNVARLIREYRGTERRARALENVLLPEITTQLAEITNSLEEADLEEMIRIRSAAR